MKTEEEWRYGIAAFVRQVRERSGLSRSKLADMMGVNVHTLGNWESGKSAPDLPQLLHMMELLGEHILPLVLEFLYPDVHGSAADADARERVKHFVDLAPESFVRQCDFLIRGEHGVNFAPLLQFSVMFLCLPTEARYMIDNVMNTLWDLNARRGALKQLPGAQPDVLLFKHALKQLGDALYAGQDTYTTALIQRVPQRPQDAPTPEWEQTEGQKKSPSEVPS